MPKFPTFPILYNETLQISITKLKEWGYLNPDQIKSGVLTWSSNGVERAAISIMVNTLVPRPYVVLSYEFKGEPRKYEVLLDSCPSNIGNGVIWYFVCPKTSLRCRKLYSIGGYFYHREAFNGCMYESQTVSKKYRQIDKDFGAYFKSDSLYDQLYKKHFKKTYAGKPTKKYLSIIGQIQKAEKISYRDIELLMLS